MSEPDRGLLDGPDITVLYRRLGEAWYAQLLPSGGNSYLLETAAEVGRREFLSLVPQFEEARKQRSQFGAVEDVHPVVRCSWPMPINVVAELAVQLGLLRADVDAFDLSDTITLRHWHPRLLTSELFTWDATPFKNQPHSAV